jgi:hypothetical protein
MLPLCEKGVLQCICLEVHRYVQVTFWRAVVAKSTVIYQHRYNLHMAIIIGVTLLRLHVA